MTPNPPRRSRHSNTRSYLFALNERTAPILNQISAIDEFLASGALTVEEVDKWLDERTRLWKELTQTDYAAEVDAEKHQYDEETINKVFDLVEQIIRDNEQKREDEEQSWEDEEL